MLSVEDAQNSVLGEVMPLAPGVVPFQVALQQVLAEDVASDLDMPPYDKALMDGFAVRTADLPGGRGELAVVGEIVAGQTPWSSDRSLVAEQAVRIMTGAAIPPGADAVVMIERTEQLSAVSGQSSVVRIDDPRVVSSQNIMRRGAEMTRGQVVLRAGTRLRPSEIGVLAAVGRASVLVYPRPRVAIISTGNEIVEAHETPGPGQIRNSNGATLTALVARAGGAPEYLGIARDTNDDLRRLVRRGLESDILLLSGGVSAGDLDLVPAVLRELSVREVFHKVNLKPGKPVWFGTAEGRGSRVEGQEPHPDRRDGVSEPSTLNPQLSSLNSLIFGLPGNPVSVFVCFELFVRPAIRQLMGVTPAVPQLVTAVLAANKDYRSDRPTYWPAWLEHGDAGYRIRPVAWQGSPDLRAMTDANAFLFFPPGDHHLRAGDRVQALRMDE